jgi:RNA polymerase sigma-70 factor (ECF subfamily)
MRHLFVWERILADLVDLPRDNDVVSQDSGPEAPEIDRDAANAADAALVLAVAGGDRKALAALYDRHGSAMLGLGVRVLRNRRDAEDVLHDVFLEVWRRAHTYDRTRASVRGWLFLMMRSRSLDKRKSAAFALSTSLEVTGLDAVASKASSLGGSSTSTGEAAVLALDHKRAVEALSRLPEAQQHVVILGYFEGLSSSEIAAELDLPIGTVKSRVAAAMRALRDSLGVDVTAGAEREGAS